MSSGEDKKTGIFHSKSAEELVVMAAGKEICRYASIEEFVCAHQQGLKALEENQADLLERYYKTLR